MSEDTAITAPAKKQRGIRICLTLIGVGIIAILLVLWGRSLLVCGQYIRCRQVPSGGWTITVHYRVTGTVRHANVTYTNAEGDVEQHEVIVPWITEIDMKNNSFVSMSAQSAESGTIACTIFVNTHEFKTSTSKGENNIANCSGTTR